MATLGDKTTGDYGYFNGGQYSQWHTFNNFHVSKAYTDFFKTFWPNRVLTVY